MNLDQAKEILSSYEMLYKELEPKAYVVFNIRKEYFSDTDRHDATRVEMESVGVAFPIVTVTSEYYCCGDTDHQYTTFPLELLLKDEQDVRAYFQDLKMKTDKELEKQKEQKKIDEAKQKIKDAQRKHKDELEQLRVLVACYPSEAHETLKEIQDVKNNT